MGAVQSAWSSTCFENWICTIRILHNISSIGSVPFGSCTTSRALDLYHSDPAQHLIRAGSRWSVWFICAMCERSGTSLPRIRFRSPCSFRCPCGLVARVLFCSCACRPCCYCWRYYVLTLFILVLVLVLVRVLAFLLLRVRFSQGMSKQNRNRKSNNEKKKTGRWWFPGSNMFPFVF